MRQSPQTVTVVNQPPDFELDTLEGDSVRLSDLVGNRVILLDFWATYCDPCLVAMPHLQKLYDQYREQGFIVLGISIDGPESAASVRSTVAKLRVEFPVLLDDDSRVVAQYNPKTSAPFSVLIGRDGRILAQQEGFTTGNAAALDEAVAEATGGDEDEGASVEMGKAAATVTGDDAESVAEDAEEEPAEEEKEA